MRVWSRFGIVCIVRTTMPDRLWTIGYNLGSAVHSPQSKVQNQNKAVILQEATERTERGMGLTRQKQCGIILT